MRDVPQDQLVHAHEGARGHTLAAPADEARRGVSAQADELYLNESLSGNRGLGRDAMPREPHANGHGMRAHGISSLKISVVTVVNDLGDCTAQLAGRGRPTVDEVRAGLAPEDVAGAEVSTGSLASYIARSPRRAPPPTTATGPGRPPATSSGWSTRCASGCAGSSGASAA